LEPSYTGRPFASVTWFSPPDGWFSQGSGCLAARTAACPMSSRFSSRTDLTPVLPSPAGNARPGSPSASDDADVAAGARKFLGALSLLAADSTRSFFHPCRNHHDGEHLNEDPRFPIVTVAE
jgi:hypothetical protein